MTQTPLEVAIAEINARRSRAQQVVDSCDQALTGLRLLMGEDGERRAEAVVNKLARPIRRVHADTEARRAAMLKLIGKRPATFHEIAQALKPPAGVTSRQHFHAMRNTVQYLRRKGLIKSKGDRWVVA